MEKRSRSQRTKPIVGVGGRGVGCYDRIYAAADKEIEGLVILDVCQGRPVGNSVSDGLRVKLYQTTSLR